MQQLSKQIVKIVFVLFLLANFINTSSAQYSKGNSPYSRYGFGDLRGTMFVPNASTGGGLAATYRSYWDVNLTNPASLGKLRFTAFDMGMDYQHSELSEKNTGLKAQADNANLNYVSLAFPITKSWEVMRDTLRRGVPIQWGMAFNLMPYSFVNYDVAVIRTVNNIPNVKFNYTGEGSKYRVNWSNGISYKGFSAGANLGILFGKINNSTFITFQDSSYALGYNERFVVEETGTGFIWDIGFQYEYIIKNKANEASPDPDFSVDNKITAGFYMGGVSNITTSSHQQYTRESAYHPTDSIRNVAGAANTLNMPLKLGGGISYGKELGLLVGVSYETELWSMYRREGVADPNLANSHRISAGLQITPDFADFTSYFNRIRYRVGAHYALDARTFTDVSGKNYQLMDYGLSLGAGFPMRPPKSKAIVGFVNLGFDIGYLGHPELISDIYFKVNLGFTLNASGWFSTQKFN